MHIVDQWTGRLATALQFSLRMTHDEFAELLGVARRTVAAWHERPETVLRAELQRALDTCYERSSDAAQTRFVRQLERVGRAQEGVPLTAAVAIVVLDSTVLLVCRRDAGGSGTGWQFPAGVVKPGALAAQVAVRETFAETGVHCVVHRNLGDRIHPITRVHCEYFLCHYLAGTVENLDVAENSSVLWVPRGDIGRFIPVKTIFSPILPALEEFDDRTR
ncbi:NUDIX domain-containing protein [Longispora urticae]